MINNIFTKKDIISITNRIIPSILNKNIRLTNFKEGELEEYIISLTIKEVEYELLSKQINNKLLIREIKKIENKNGNTKNKKS